ncbi:putative echinonectin [Ostreococcus tauri virus OtV5]|uniref:Putative echinonectin n=1 Tax=Ostreococcus tauri virus OtV5 TaxID=1785753 RepID=A9YW29_9PHYC|nr:putative echinonectin [Ostreococcus tauri virus OtV5]ABY27912.2 putative echinonectin [Ostreococcus tauri virus OtV5]
MSAAAIGVVGLMLCSSSSAAAMFMMGGDEEPKVGPTLAPAAPVPPPPKPPVVVDVPAEFRTGTNPWRIASKRAAMKNHNRGHLSSPQAWSSEENKVGKWYQMDNGKIADIVGVAIKGRKNSNQWVKTFKVKYYDAGTWKDVDGGATFTGNTDPDTQVEAKFATPVKTRYIRIYPQTWNNHMSLRAGLITNSTLEKSALKLLNIPPGKRAASSWWKNNDSPSWHPQKGVLNSGTGWHIKKGGDPKVQWYEMRLDTPTKVAGVALQGRGDGDDPNKSWVWQWITSFTAMYKDSAGQWKDVDNGFVYSGVNDKDTIVWAPFNTPVSTTAVRVYPKTWHRAPTGRFDLLGSTGSSSEGYEIGGYDQEITGFSF